MQVPPESGGIGASISVMDDNDPITGLLRTGILDPPACPGERARLDGMAVTAVLGRGGMGVVLLVRDGEGTDRHAAVKVLRPDLLANPEAIRRFHRELRHQQGLQHPYILSVIRVGTCGHAEAAAEPSVPYLMMPLASRSLQSELNGRPIADERRLLRLARGVAEALRFAHSRGITHRDIKPGNVLLDDQDRPLLADFGLGRTFFNDSIVDASRSRPEGTPAYMSPAVARGEAEDTRSDVYAWGALLYEMLTGRRPYDGQTTEQVLRQVLAGPPLPIRTLRPDAPRVLVEITEHAMARELRDRYASMTDVLADLDRVQTGGAPLGPHGRTHWLPAGPGVRWRWPLYAAAMSLTLVVAWFVWRLPGYAGDTGRATAMLPGLGGDGLLAGAVPLPGDILLVDESFDTSSLNEQLWRWGQRRQATMNSPGPTAATITLDGGTAVVEAMAGHHGGHTTVQEVWLDLRSDLRLRQPIRLEIELDAPVLAGGLEICLSEGAEPVEQFDPASIRLFRWQRAPDDPTPLPRNRLSVDLMPTPGIAIVRSNRPEEVSRLVDLSRLGMYRLRFLANAVSAQDLPPGQVRARIDRVTVTTIPLGSQTVGVVSSSLSSAPISGAVVRTLDGAHQATTDSGGVFELDLPAGTHHLRFVADGFAEGAGRVELGQNQVRRIDQALAPAQPHVGDVIRSIPFDRWHPSVQALLVQTGRLLYTTLEGDQGWLYEIRTDRPEAEPRRLTRLVATTAEGRADPAPLTGLTDAGDRVLGCERWPGRLFTVDPMSGLQPLGTLPTSWPRGLLCVGDRLWVIEEDTTTAGPRHGLYRVSLDDPATLARFVTSGSTKLTGIAPVDHCLWLATADQGLWRLDPDRLEAARAIEDAVIERLPGKYHSISSSAGSLWAVDLLRQRFVCLYTGVISAGSAPGANQESSDESPREAPPSSGVHAD